jgi:flavin-dependent dehydrogenase
MKAVIIGASTSGLFLAYLLAREDVEVCLYEKSGTTNLPGRTLIVTDRINHVLGFTPEEAIINRVKFFELHSRTKTAKVEVDCPDLVIERTKLASLLASLAERAGVKIFRNCRFESFVHFGGKIEICLSHCETGEVIREHADFLIGADGCLSEVSRAANQNVHGLRAVLLQQKVALSGMTNANTSHVWFMPSYTKYFYWCIPESDQTGVVGLIADNSCSAQEGLDDFLREKGFEPLESQMAIVPLYQFRVSEEFRGSNRNIYFVGDSGAQVKVSTVGGVVSGLYGARAVAGTILKRADWKKEAKSLNIELNLHLLLRSLLNRFTDYDYDELILMVQGGLKELLQTMTRDELTKSFFKLITRQPRLISLGARVLTRTMMLHPELHPRLNPKKSLPDKFDRPSDSVDEAK